MKVELEPTTITGEPRTYLVVEWYRPETPGNSACIQVDRLGPFADTDLRYIADALAPLRTQPSPRVGDVVTIERSPIPLGDLPKKVLPTHQERHGS